MSRVFLYLVVLRLTRDIIGRHFDIGFLKIADSKERVTFRCNLAKRVDNRWHIQSTNEDKSCTQEDGKGYKLTLSHIVLSFEASSGHRPTSVHSSHHRSHLIASVEAEETCAVYS
jgi:hypothetical protein